MVPNQPARPPGEFVLDSQAEHFGSEKPAAKRVPYCSQFDRS